jgi:hypothetical protein
MGPTMLGASSVIGDSTCPAVWVLRPKTSLQKSIENSDTTKQGGGAAALRGEQLSQTRVLYGTFVATFSVVCLEQ